MFGIVEHLSTPVGISGWGEAFPIRLLHMFSEYRSGLMTSDFYQRSPEMLGMIWSTKTAYRYRSAEHAFASLSITYPLGILSPSFPITRLEFRHAPDSGSPKMD